MSPSPARLGSARVGTPDALDLFWSPLDAAIDAVHQATSCYTQDPVVAEILDLAQWPRCGTRLVDPGCGDGQFLLAAIAKLPLRTDDVEGLAARVEGWELHPQAAAAARTRVAAHLGARGWSAPARRAAAERVIVHGDFLRPTVAIGPEPGRGTPSADTIVSNPPYLRNTFIPEPLRSAYAAAVPDYALADLLHAFLDQCRSVLRPDGRIVCVTADRWLFNANAARLREVLGQHFGVAALRRLDPRTSFYRPKVRRAGMPPRVHPVAVMLTPEARHTAPLGRAPVSIPDDGAHGHASRPAATPADPSPRGGVVPDRGTGPEASSRAVVPLGDVAFVKLGPWMGREGIFVLDAREGALLDDALAREGVSAADRAALLVPSPAGRPRRRRSCAISRRASPGSPRARGRRPSGRRPSRGDRCRSIARRCSSRASRAGCVP